MTRKNAFLYVVITFITAITFLYNQCIWAIGLETLHNYLPENPQHHLVYKNLKPEVNLPQKLQETSLKVICRFIKVLAEKPNFEAEITSVGAKNPIQTCVISSGNDSSAKPGYILIRLLQSRYRG